MGWCVRSSARVSVGSLQMPWCSGRCGTAVQRQNVTISLEWLIRSVKALNEPTNEPIGERKKHYVFTTVQPKQREAAEAS